MSVIMEGMYSREAKFPTMKVAKIEHTLSCCDH
jgi:hypothetical protein